MQRPQAQFNINADNIADAIHEIAYYGSCVRLVNCIEELLHAFSNRDFIGFDEKYIKIALFAYANMSNLYLVKSEYEVSDGYIDIALLKREPWYPDFYAIFELKYLKLHDTRPAEIEKAVLEGTKQLERYNTSPELSLMRNLKKWVLVFAGDRCASITEI